MVGIYSNCPLGAYKSLTGPVEQFCCQPLPLCGVWRGGEGFGRRNLNFSSVYPAPCTTGEQPHGTPPLTGLSSQEAVFEDTCGNVCICVSVFLPFKGKLIIMSPTPHCTYVCTCVYVCVSRVYVAY